MRKLYLTALLSLFSSTIFAQIPIVDVCSDCNNGGCGEWFLFEDDPSDNSYNYIQIDTDSTNVWQMGYSSKNVLSSGPYLDVLITDTLNSYPSNNTSTFEFAVRNCDQFTAYYSGAYYWLDMYMNMSYDTDAGKDGLMIEVKHGINGAWINLIDDTTPGLNLQNIYTASDTVEALGKPGYSGSATQTQLQLQYPVIANGLMYDTIYFKMTFGSDSIDNNRDGFMFTQIAFGGFFWSIEEHMVLEPLKLYPNPAMDYVTIDTDDFTNGQVIVYDMSGREVINHRFGNGRVDVSGLDPGRYVVRCSTDDKIQKGNLLIR